MSGKRLTALILLAAVILLAGYDLFAVLQWDVDSTLSVVIWEASLKIPAIPFAAGFLCGHLFT